MELFVFFKTLGGCSSRAEAPPVHMGCRVNAWTWASTSQALTGHVSVLESKKISLLRSCFFICSEKLCSEGWRVLQVFRSLWDVWQRMCAAEVCVSWKSYLKFHWDKKNANQQKNFEELCCTVNMHNKKATILFVSNTHVHGATLCSQSAQFHNCRFVSPAAVRGLTTKTWWKSSAIPCISSRLMFKGFCTMLEIRLSLRNSLKRVF